MNSEADYYADNDNDNDVPTPTQRRSRLFCGMCDFRTCTVVLNILHMVFVTFLALTMCLVYTLEGGPFVWRNLGATVGGAFLGIALSLSGLHAAMHWNLFGLYFVIVGFFIMALWHIWTRDWLDFVLVMVLLYSHILLAYEIRSGLLTVETFEEEEYVMEGGKEFVQIAHGYIVTTTTTTTPASTGSSTGPWTTTV